MGRRTTVWASCMSFSLGYGAIKLDVKQSKKEHSLIPNGTDRLVSDRVAPDRVFRRRIEDNGPRSGWRDRGGAGRPHRARRRKQCSTCEIEESHRRRKEENRLEHGQHHIY